MPAQPNILKKFHQARFRKNKIWLGTFLREKEFCLENLSKEGFVNGIIYLVGLVVVVMFVLSVLGIR
jgi:small-conductance mechanosensitive channel